MIHYYKRNQIAIAKYNTCIKKSINTRIYAYSWYLDIVTYNWDVLVLNDYEAVMPLPWRSKYLIKYIYPPAWTQQLGVFSEKEISSKLISQFIKAIPNKFKKITIQFNSKNDLSLFKVQKRVNYVLLLNKSYDEIYKGFNKNRKRDLKKALMTNSKIDREIKATEFLDFYLKEQKGYELNKNQIVTLNQLLNTKNKSVFIWGVRVNEKLIASLVWLKKDRRITYLLPVANKEAKNTGLTTLLVNTLIKQFSTSNFQLDFEGSMIKGVANFYKGFGAEEEAYTVCQKSLFSSVKSQYILRGFSY
ncbi:hypothetical protein [Lutibacter sp.]